MGRRSSVETLPPDVRERIDRALYQSGFSDYSALTTCLRAEGYPISRTALHRYGQKLQVRVERMGLEKLLAG